MPQQPFVDEPLSDQQQAAFEDTPIEAPRPRHPAADILPGIGAGVASTVYHGGDLIRRALGLDRIIDKPDVQAAMTPPSSGGGKLGFYGEQGAEFLVPLTKLGTALKGERMLIKVLGEAGAGGAVAGVQSGGDPVATTLGTAFGAAAPPIGKAARYVGETAQRAAYGAKEGGLGGAVASVIRNAAPADPTQLMMQGVKPRASQVRFEPALKLAMPELKATESQLGRPIASVDDLLEATSLAKKRVRAEYERIAGPIRATTIDLSPVADDIVASVPSKVRLERPAEAARIAETAAVYRRPFKLDEAEQLLKETNAELDSFYAKFPGGQRKALEGSSEAASLNAQATSLRKAIYDHLDLGSGASQEIQRRYGSLMAVEEEAFRRMNVAKRLQPESLAEQVSGARGIGDLVRGTYKVLVNKDITGAADIASGYATREAAKFMKEQQTSNAMIRRAFEALGPFENAATRPVRGLLPRGALRTPTTDTSGTVTPQPRDMPRSYPVSERLGLPEREPPRQLGPMPDTSGSVEPPSWMPKQYPLSPETVKGLSREELISRISGVQRTPGLAPEEAAQLMQILRAEMQRRGISLVPLRPKAPSGTYTQQR